MDLLFLRKKSPPLEGVFVDTSVLEGAIEKKITKIADQYFSGWRNDILSS